jgi:hypothetical protein
MVESVFSMPFVVLPPWQQKWQDVQDLLRELDRAPAFSRYVRLVG